MGWPATPILAIGGGWAILKVSLRPLGVVEPLPRLLGVAEPHLSNENDWTHNAGNVTRLIKIEKRKEKKRKR